jgi:hypothetical protein
MSVQEKLEGSIMLNNLMCKKHNLLVSDFNNAYDWFLRNKGQSKADDFENNYLMAIYELEIYPYHSHSLSTFHFFDKILNDDFFRYLKLGKRTSYCLFNYPKRKNYILACMSMNRDGKFISNTLQIREQTK